MAYTFSVANTPATGAVAMYLLSTTLVTAGWTVMSDSDGTTYDSNGGQVTTGAAGAGGLGNVRAWIRLQAPTVGSNTREITIQRSATGVAATDDRAWRIKYSANAGFTGGSPAATVTPSATDEVFMLGGGTDASPTFAPASWFNANAAYRWHIAAGGAAENYSFVAWGHVLGAVASMATSIALDVLAPGGYSVLDIDPAVMYCSTAINTIATDIHSSGAPTANVTNPAKARAWLGATSAAGASLTSNNVNVCTLSIGSSVIGNAGTVGSNPWTNKDDLLPCLWVSTITTGTRGIKGFSTLFMQGSVHKNNMDTIDTTIPGAKDKVYFANLWFPWSGATPLI